MRYLCLLFFILAVKVCCFAQFDNTTWKVYYISSSIEEGDFLLNSSLNNMINDKVEGTKIIISNNVLQIIGNDINVKGKIIKIDSSILFIEQNGETFEIKYELSDENKKCNYIFADGTILYSKRM